MAQVRSQSGPSQAQTRTRNMIKKKNVNLNNLGGQTTTENRIKNTTNPKSFSMNNQLRVRNQYRKAFSKNGKLTK